MAISQAVIDDLARKGAERGVDLRPGLALVERRLREVADAPQPFVAEVGRYLIEAGGKRFRPMLVLLAGMLGDAESSDGALVDAGVVVELVHLSSLYHDDVIDGAEVRRGAPAIHVKWSNTVAILTGDYLLARAAELSAALGVAVTRTIAATIADLSMGELREVQGSAAAAEHGADRVTPNRDHYLRVIGEKSASLIAASCRLGALLTEQPAPVVATLGEYGWRLGMSFQLADDVLDVASVSSESGKVPGTDLKEGVRTLPVLLAVEADGPGSTLERLLDDPTDANVGRALEILREHRALELAREAARLEAATAKQALDALPPALAARPAADGLRYLADYAADRAG